MTVTIILVDVFAIVMVVSAYTLKKNQRHVEALFCISLSIASVVAMVMYVVYALLGAVR